MGVNLTYGTSGATGGGFSAMPGTIQPTFSEDMAEPRWNWQSRSPKTLKDRSNFVSLWSFGCRVGSGDFGGYYVTNRCTSCADVFEPYSCDGEGTQTQLFIRGTTYDANNVAISGVTVQAFKTSDETFAGQSVSQTDGTYICPVHTVAGTQHYLVAYKPGSPDITGATVNTLTSTNVDGT